MSQQCIDAEFELLKAELADSEVNPVLQKMCAREIREFCDKAHDGSGGMVTCLQDAKEKEGFGLPCLQVITKVIRLQNLDSRLNPNLEKFCSSDINVLCFWLASHSTRYPKPSPKS